jgi:DNA invertase Pin-like site-specific DNA recombinase
MATTNAVGYVRVSTDEQERSGAGIEAQRAAITAELERRGWRLVGIEQDTATGKSTKRRPGLAAALQQLAAGDADSLVVAKLDRLSRSLLDFASLVEQSRREGWSLVALDLGVDTTTPSGEMMANVLAVFAQFERRLIAQRTKDGLAAKREAGTLNRPIGRPRLLPDDVVKRIRAERQPAQTRRRSPPRSTLTACRQLREARSGGRQRWRRCCSRRRLGPREYGDPLICRRPA